MDLIDSAFYFLNERNTFLKKQHFDFADVLRVLQAVINLFLFKVARVAFKLIPCHWMSVKMVHLLDVKASRGIVVVCVAVTALQPDQFALFSQMLSYTFVWIAIIWSAKAFVLIAGAVTWLYMPFKLGHSVNFGFLKSSAAMSNFYFVNNIL